MPAPDCNLLWSCDACCIAKAGMPLTQAACARARAGDLQGKRLIVRFAITSVVHAVLCAALACISVCKARSRLDFAWCSLSTQRKPWEGLAGSSAWIERGSFDDDPCMTLVFVKPLAQGQVSAWLVTRTRYAPCTACHLHARTHRGLPASLRAPAPARDHRQG